MRIDRIFRQPQGHLLLIGVSGAGKTTLSRYRWENKIVVHLFKDRYVFPFGIMNVLYCTHTCFVFRFVAWMNGLTVFQIKVHNKYSAEDFDEDLRQVLRRSGTVLDTEGSSS